MLFRCVYRLFPSEVTGELQLVLIPISSNRHAIPVFLLAVPAGLAVRPIGPNQDEKPASDERISIGSSALLGPEVTKPEA